MKNNWIKIGLILICLNFMFSCGKNKKDSTGKSTSTEMVSDHQKEVQQLQKNVDSFDQEYSEFVRNFYDNLNKLNKFIKEDGKDIDLMKGVLADFLEEKKHLEIKVPEGLQEDFQPVTQKMERIYHSFLDLQNQVQKYIETEEWTKDNREFLYDINAKAEELTYEYEKYSDELHDKIEKTQ